jgi:EAL domain-containing protein (putative c-di-GMP-specific phosphodiesterase class I)
LEITEHAVVDDYDDLLDCLAAFRYRGGKVAIDDAGAGYASLRHILRIRPEIIKLDIGMVHGVDVAPARRALVTALVSFAAEIHAALVAEGIETEGELEIMKQAGIRFGQGFLLSRPKALDDLGSALRTFPLGSGNGSRTYRRARA